MAPRRNADWRAVATAVETALAAKGWTFDEWHRSGGPSYPTIKNLLSGERPINKGEPSSYATVTLRKASLSLGQHGEWLERILYRREPVPQPEPEAPVDWAQEMALRLHRLEGEVAGLREEMRSFPQSPSNHQGRTRQEGP